MKLEKVFSSDEKLKEFFEDMKDNEQEIVVTFPRGRVKPQIDFSVETKSGWLEMYLYNRGLVEMYVRYGKRYGKEAAIRLFNVSMRETKAFISEILQDYEW